MSWSQIWACAKFGGKISPIINNPTTRLCFLQIYGLEDVMVVGVVLALSNLSYRGIGATPPWPTAALNDLTVIGSNPREKHLVAAVARLQSQLPVSGIYVRNTKRDKVLDMILRAYHRHVCGSHRYGPRGTRYCGVCVVNLSTTCWVV